jgi:3-oxoacyl-[acyl-carrier-protein] synthase-3
LLVIGTDTLARITDWTDRNTAILFADGSGAVVLEACDGPGQLLGWDLDADGAAERFLYAEVGGFIQMEGKEVFRYAVNFLAEIIEEAFAATGLTAADVDWFVPHQANRRIIEATARKLSIDPAKVVMTVENHGNTSAASIPLALSTAVADGRIKKGQVVLMEAMGGGFTWGSALVRW